MTLDELANSVLVVGPGDTYPNWDSQWRGELVENLRVLVRDLRRTGITEIYIDGSFVTDKDHPGDIDGYSEVPYRTFVQADFQQILNTGHSAPVWELNQSRWVLAPGKGVLKSPIWHQYSIEYYWDLKNLPPGLPESSIDGKPVGRFFRETRTDEARGIVKIVR